VNTKIAPSLDCADYVNLKKDIEQLEAGGADILHIDIMDGHFVPNFTAGPNLVSAVSEITDIPVETHFQMEKNTEFIQMFLEAGSDIITFHAESCDRYFQAVQQIKEADKKASIALNPGTPVSMIEHVLSRLDMIIMMCVDPGFAGQSFIKEVLPKIERVKEIIDNNNLEVDIAVDGNINKETIKLTKNAGANVFILGTSSIFQEGADREERTKIFKDYCEQV